MFLTAGRLLAVLVLAGLGVVLGQLPAQACSCATASTQAQTKAANDVFTGTITNVEAEPKPDGQRGATMTYDVAVDRVYKGGISMAEVQVTSDRAPASCGLGRLPADRRYVFFARSDGSELSADSCGGTARAGNALVAKVEKLLGDGRAAVRPEPEQAVYTVVSDAAPRTFMRTAAPGVALALAGLLGLFVVGRLGTRA